MAEQWRTVAGHPGYIVSDLGRVRRSLVGAPILKGDIDHRGRHRVLLQGKHRQVHRLVCEAFHGPCPPTFECGHLDGDCLNNRASNLAWISRSENVRHSILHGTYVRPTPPHGEGHCHATITDEQVKAIRERAAAGASGRALAREFGISKSQAHRIIAREARTDV